MRPIPRQRLLHHLAEGVAAIDLVVAEALQHHELLGLAGARIHGFALLRRHQAVVVGGDEQDRPRRDAVDHPFGIEAERVVDELQRHLRHCRWIVAPRRRAQFGRLAVRQQYVVAVGKLGDTFLGPGLVPKRLALLKEGLPTLSHVGILWHPGAFGEATIRNLVAEVTQAAKALSLQPHLAAARNPDEIDGAFASIIAERAQAVFVFPSSMLFSQRKRVVELITKHGLPATFPAREYAQLGGLMAYGASITELWRRSAF